MRLVIHHQAGRPSAGPLPPASLVWRTCLREVAFLPPAAEFGFAPVLTNGDAYALLLEILCGLRSPMVGETEVMGQFKAFLGSGLASDAWLSRIGERLLADAGRVRERHLRQLGSRTYGSAVRRRLRAGEHAALLGAGQLGSSILPFLACGERPVDVWGRREPIAVAGLGRATYRRLPASGHDDVTTGAASLVVAAPVAAGVIEELARAYAGLRSVIDLRSDGQADPVALASSVTLVSLGDIFSDLEAGRASEAMCAEAARADIRRLSREFDRRTELHPFGWDDLCA